MKIKTTNLTDRDWKKYPKLASNSVLMQVEQINDSIKRGCKITSLEYDNKKHSLKIKRGENNISYFYLEDERSQR